MVRLRLLVLCIVAMCVSAMGWAQEPNVTTGKVLPVAVKATPIFDGYVRDNVDAVLYVEAINKGPDMTGSLVFQNEDLGTGKTVRWSVRWHYLKKGVSLVVSLSTGLGE